ncbi:MAG TPA: alpha/beta hydrolase, partial [Acidimicrobiaceae bacterium]|nr:alpha/beta hydrolase [Acidimicrobiaceae bacterium]
AAAGAIVLGVSWGGVIATRLALRRPELVAGLVLADSSCGAG